MTAEANHPQQKIDCTRVIHGARENDQNLTKARFYTPFYSSIFRGMLM
jgi:hypothetical protein